jgi:two-component system nitrate/nitrite response regulator NarL
MQRSVLVVEDHPLFREALCGRLEHLGFRVAGVCEDGTTALGAYRRLRPDMVLVDLHLPGLSGTQVVERVRSEGPDARVVVLSAYDDVTSIRQALDAGADGFISKRVSAAELADCLEDSFAGRSAFDRQSALRAVDALRSRADAPLLSPREQEVLALIADGRTSDQIGAELFIAATTVKTHVASILRKLAASDRSSAVARAFRHGILT